MSKIKNKNNNSTERRFEEIVKDNIDFQFSSGDMLIGKPDFTIENLKIAIFIDGSFWHGYPDYKLPTTNAEFWRKKIETNRQRDRFVNKKLRKDGWSVIRFWDFELKKKNQRNTLRRLRRIISIKKKIVSEDVKSV